MSTDKNDEVKAEAVALALAENICATLNASRLKNPEVEIRCHVLALIEALVSVLASIPCKECRQVEGEHIVEDLLPSALDYAMKLPASEHGHLH